MKHIKYLSFFLSILFFAACSKEDNAKLPDGIQKVNIPVIKKDANSQQSINFSNISSFEGKYTVNYYFADGTKPEKGDVVVIKNGVRTNPKILNSGVTTFPASFTTNAAALEALFGQPTALGDSYTLGLDLFQDGKKYEAFPVVGTAYGTALNNLPGSSLSIRYEAVCPFSIDDFVGDFEVVSDEWEDYAAGDVVTLSKVSATSVSFTYLANEAKPIVVVFNAATGTLTVAKQVYGSSYGNPADWTYSELSCETEAGATVNVFSACDKSITLALKHTVSVGSFGVATIKLKKK